MSPPTLPRLSPVGALSAFVAATLLCGVSLADDGLTKGSTEFFDQYCAECHYEDQERWSRPERPDIRPGQPGQPRHLGPGVRSCRRRRNAAEEEEEAPRAGGPRDVHPNRFVVSHRLREGSHGPGRPRHAAPAEPLRIRKRAARSAERPVGAGEGQAAARRRSVIASTRAARRSTFPSCRWSAT